MSDSNNNLSGSISFIQYKRPPLEAGEYKINIEQYIREAGQSFKETHQIAVIGQRFSLRGNDIRKVFPPAESTGEYANVLPHIVFTRPTFPWERTTEAPEQGKYKKRADTADILGQQQPDYKPRQSWLTLLAFDQDEVALPMAKAAEKVQVNKGKVTDLFNPPSGVFSYFTKSQESDSSLKIENILDYGESGEDPCKLLDIPLDIFNAIAPSGPGLNWLAHARELDLPDGTPENLFSIVLGNRLARPGRMTTVHLVSLEGLADFLPDEAGEKSDAFARLKGNYTTIRLASLHSWQYSAVEEKITFGAILEKLNHSQKGDSLLRRAVRNTTGNPKVINAMQRGFLALPYYPRSGGPSMTWYRGPFVPEPPAAKVVYITQPPGDPSHLNLPARSADGLIFYDADKGLLDISYASAWQMGRLLALANREFSTGFYRWTNQLVQEAARLAKPLLPAPTKRKEYYTQAVKKLADPKVMKSLWPNNAPASAGKPSPYAMPENLRLWLSRLLCLHGLPFSYLVPDEEMLPLESIRFFQVDESWLRCLVDGALSLGRSTVNSQAIGAAFAPDLFQQACQPVLDAQKKKWEEADTRLTAIYKKAGKTISLEALKREVDNMMPDSIDFSQLSGFLLRSSVVRGWWPGILADGYQQEKKVAGIRCDRLSNEVMLCLFGGLISKASIHEPPEGLHFGFDFTIDSKDEKVIHLKKSLRALSGGQAGNFLKDGSAIKFLPPDKIQMRPGGHRILLIDSLFQAIKTALGNPQPFTAAEFALEMVEGVQLVNFELKNNPLS